MSIKPSNHPQGSRAMIDQIAAKMGVDTSKPWILGCRGFYRDTMGRVGVNDRGLYDDAIFIVMRDGYKGYNANTDPSAVYKRGVACLVPGVYPYKKGKHKGQYWALRPATKDEELPVARDGIKDPEPGVAINIHKGSLTTTSSLGCQTIYPAQWPEFQNLVYQLMDEAGLNTIQYCLVEHQG